MSERFAAEKARAIRSLDRPDVKIVPIIAITANAFQEDVQKCLEAGMNAHLAKPLDMEKVQETICAQVGNGSHTMSPKQRQNNWG